ncbi:hypothetical protein BUALT_Bualt07G0166200 [Buddleja alternifolia]|uniref:NB-ARC domain-containing protein n=1 Tax=Buddleja alternifolia TaxID=168488 RepID=A0AAV6XM81_9LAMI|nr:hypothetical protein BUALT_Bualt07G0166200 [Buddleja alternifolia]
MDMIVEKKARYAFMEAQPVEPRAFHRGITTSFVEVSEIQGRRDDTDIVVNKLILGGAGQEGRDPCVISIVGTGGIGKTTLAQLVCNDDRVKNCFKKTIWICVSNVSDEVKIAKGIIEKMNGSSSNFNELDSLLQLVADLISGEKILLVPDDVWEEYCTKREVDCDKLQNIGRNIAKKCNGLPLAAKVLGSHLRFKNTMEDYNELSPAMKRCFSYCVIFPKDYEIDVEKLIRMWMAQGYLSINGSSAGDLKLRGRYYFDILSMRSFFQEVWKRVDGVITCKMHDIIHDFAQFLRERKSQNTEGSIEATTKELSGACDPSLLTQIKVYRSLVFQDYEDLLPSSHLIKSLRVLRVLEWKKIEREIKNLIRLRYLDMHGLWLDRIPQTLFKLYNLETLYLGMRQLREVPKEIENLIHLRHLDLSSSHIIEELPETICNLHHLRTLGLDGCYSLERLPEGIDRLINLTHLRNSHTFQLKRIPQGLEQLTGLRTLNVYNVGTRSWCKLRYLNKLDKLSGDFKLKIQLHDTEDVIEARKAKLRNKIDIQNLFSNSIERTDEGESVWNNVMEALQPPPNLLSLIINGYEGTKFPGWITSSLNHLTTLYISNTHYCSSLPPFGKLPCLEWLEIFSMDNLEFLGREFLGIAISLVDDINVPTPSPSPSPSPSMEDITAEEEVSATVSIMPCLEELAIIFCRRLTVLPHRLLRKASSFQHLEILGSPLYNRYEDKEGSDRRSLSHIPSVEMGM